MDPGQGLRQIAVALVGDDDGGAGLGDEEVGAGDADVGVEEAPAQDGARLLEQVARLLDAARAPVLGVMLGEGVGEVAAREMDRRGDDVARRLVPELQDVLAEVGLDRGDAVLLEEVVEADLLGDHRLALGDRLRAGGAADVEDGLARLGRRAAPVHPAALLAHLRLEGLEVGVEVLERVVLDVAAGVAQVVEFGQAADRDRPLLLEAGVHVEQRLLERLRRRAPGARCP